MNNATLKELKIVVERAVRPVRATTDRKRKMREELLAHLTTIFEEEVQRTGDERAALDQARRRFGDPRELSGQLQESVPRTDGFSRVVEDILLYRVGESALRHAVRVASLNFSWIGATLALVPPVLLVRGRTYEILWMQLTLLIAGAVLFGGTIALALLAHGLRATLFAASSARSPARAVVYGLLSALVIPLCGLVLIWAATGDFAAGYAHFRFLCWSVVLAPLALILVARQMADEARYSAEWADLKIEE
jgi:hypothetical protein